MKNLILLLALFLSSSFAFAQNMPLAEPLAEENLCTHTFEGIDNDHDFDIFENRVEGFLKTSSFWQDCIKPVLDSGKSVNIFFTSATAKDIPTVRENRLAVFSAKEFKSEFEDYVEDYQEHLKPAAYRKPERFTNMSMSAPVKQTQDLTYTIQRANKKFKAKSKEPKVNILIDYKKSDVPGTIEISVK